MTRRLWLLQGQDLCREVRRKTGLDDFGVPCLEPAFSTLLKSLEQEAELHTLGRFLMRVHLRGLLETRLRLAASWKPENERLRAEPIERPVFITGMPRSGSTFLHELLAQDPQNRAPRVWEVMFPVPDSNGKHDDWKGRFHKAQACLWWFRRLAPQADAVYPMRAATPHECVAIHSYTFLSEEFNSTCHIPSYEAFLRGTDLTPVYEWEKNFLQYLQRRCPIRRWILKSPDHVYGLEQLFRVFPDALIIQTHRNPLEALRSSTELTLVLRGLYGHPGAPSEIRARESRILAEGTERFIRFRDQHPELAHRFIDVKYRMLVTEPLAAIRGIYQALGMTLTPLAAERMQALAAGRSRYRGGRRAQAFADDCLDAQAEAKKFERYCSRFDLPLGLPELR
jgi:hypothetical protein